LKKTDVWKLLNGLAAIFEVALPNQHSMAAQLSTVFGRGLPTTTPLRTPHQKAD